MDSQFVPWGRNRRGPGPWDARLRKYRFLVGRAFWSLLLGMMLPFPSNAQLVQGEVLERGTSLPIEGALVVLLDQEGAQRGSYLTNDAGRFQIRAPGPGRYTLRVERIGLETLRREGIELAAAQVLHLRLEMGQKPIELAAVRVEGTQQCVVRPAEGLLLAEIWDEARKALAAGKWTEEQGMVRFQVTQYERELDPATRLMVWEGRTSSQWLTRTPIRSLPVEHLLEEGFIQPAEGGGYSFFGPDAAVLLSDLFLETHCFRLAEDETRPELVGLAFEPVRRRTEPDITGTLWLERTTSRLQFLEFAYTRSPWMEAEGVASGRVQFEEMPNGAWIVRRWWIRMPRMVRDHAVMGRGRSGLRVAGIVEAGGEVTRTSIPAAKPLPETALGVVSGHVWDSIKGGPLVDARVHLEGTQYAAATDSAGHFVLKDVPSGSYRVSFTHPRLDSLGVYPAGEDVRVVGVVGTSVPDTVLTGVAGRIGEAGEAGGNRVGSEVFLALPSQASVLDALCRASGRDPGTAAVVGTVREGPQGDPVPGAKVVVEWTDFRVVQGREFQSDVFTVEATADHRGRFRACGISPGLVAAQANVGDSAGTIRKVEVGSDQVVVLDLSLESPPEVAGERGPACAPETALGDQGSIGGQVLDAATGVSIGNVRVWLVPEAPGEPRTMEADGGGRFLICGVEPGGYTLRSVFRGFGDAQATVSVQPGQHVSRDVLLVFADPERRSGTVKGRVVEGRSGDPLAGASVILNGGEQVRISGDDGSFEFREVLAGAVEIVASLMGFADATGGIVVGGGQTLELEVRLSLQPIELEPIVVEASRMDLGGGILGDVRRRAQRGWGTVLLREDLESRRAVATRVTDLLQGFAGVHVQGSTARNLAIYLRVPGCGPLVYLDGVKVTRGARATAFSAAEALNQVHPMDIEAIEIYRGPAQTPGEFLDSNAACGVILIWTRRGG
jgi:hypothetical protein